MRRILAFLLFFSLIAGNIGAAGDMDKSATTKASPATLPIAQDVKVTLVGTVEEGKALLEASVTKNGSPVENAKVVFGARRTFGRLFLGSDETLDDGTAAIAFPSDLPGDDLGNLILDAVVTGPSNQWTASVQSVLPGGKPKVHPPGTPPRALWAPSAPIGLIVAIALIVGSAWGAYVFVGFQLLAIKRGASK